MSQPKGGQDDLLTWYAFGMDAELVARISPEHRRRLAWFEAHAGEVVPMPGPIEGDLLLVSKPKGIFKPADLPYALSIRINLGRYTDGKPLSTPGGGWELSYHQENADPADRDKAWANRGLMRCIDDWIPVGVLREVGPKRRPSQYEVLGLALPVRWADGYFFLESLDPPAAPAADIITDVLEATARSVQDDADEAALPADDYDARLRIYRQIVARQGQSAFRAALMAGDGGRCAITGCDATGVLEAAHLRPYRGPDSNVVTNGLLLRSDVHTLLDLRLLALDPTAREVVLSKLLAGTQYESLSGRRVADPAEGWQRPSQDALDSKWWEYTETENAR